MIDNRYLAEIGKQALGIHSIQFNFFLVGQAIGLASATSALIFWKRKEVEAKQGFILLQHLILSGLASAAVAILVFPFTGKLVHYFEISDVFYSTGKLYLRLGLLSMILQAMYAAINAVLIASDQRFKSTLLIGLILTIKIIVGYFAVHTLAPHDPSSAMIVIACGTIFSVGVSLLLGIRFIVNRVDGWKRFEFRSLSKVWTSEVATGAIRSLAPIAFSFQIARVYASPGFFVTCQLALHLAYLLVLPQLAGTQIAVRDASAELSEGRQMWSHSSWFPPFLYTSLLPTQILLWFGVFFAVPLFSFFYKYNVPLDHRSFLPLYFLGCSMGQIGNLFVILLRASRRNFIATRNSLFTELFLQLGLTQLLLLFGWATPTTIGLTVCCYCFAYLFLNARSVLKVRLESSSENLSIARQAG